MADKKIVFTSDGAYEYSRDSWKDDFTKKKILGGLLTTCLGRDVEIEPGTKFGVILDCIFSDKEFYNTVFYADLEGWQLSDFEDDYKLPSEELIIDRTAKSYMEHLEVRVYAETSIFKGKKEFAYNTDFHGRGWDTFESGKHVTNFGVEFESLSKLKNYEIRIDREVFLESTNLDDFKINPTNTTVGEVSITLYEFFRAILWEISFCGNPEKRDEQSQDLGIRLEEAKESIAEMRKNGELD